MNIGIVGYGNVGKSCERIAQSSKDVALAGIFTKRNPKALTSPYNSMIYSQGELDDFVGKIDVLVLCAGSATDLVPLSLKLGKSFNTVDSFDNHSKMRRYVSDLDMVAKECNHLSIVGAGWDPGLFSLARGLFEGVLGGDAVTFWGKGVSQGHSEAIRRIEGVKMAVQYTIPNEDALESVYRGCCDGLSVYDRHKRVCYVVAENNCNKNQIEETIKNMPNYFKGYETEVYFVDEQEFRSCHSEMSHGGRVIWSRNTGGHNSLLEMSMKTQSNPDFTASVLMAYAKCAYRMYENGERGVKTILDIPLRMLFDLDGFDIIEKYL